MNMLQFFRFNASGREILVTAGVMTTFFFGTVFLLDAEDYDGDGWDDDTGEYVGGGSGGDDYSSDSDGDGLYDYDEINYYNTDPDNVDSDFDGVGDY